MFHLFSIVCLSCLPSDPQRIAWQWVRGGWESADSRCRLEIDGWRCRAWARHYSDWVDAGGFSWADGFNLTRDQLDYARREYVRSCD